MIVTAVTAAMRRVEHRLDFLWAQQVVMGEELSRWGGGVQQGNRLLLGTGGFAEGIGKARTFASRSIVGSHSQGASSESGSDGRLDRRVLANSPDPGFEVSVSA
jgi:hypothetical protein